jgi:tetratricopeptide (TPR) repeat protein
MIPIALLWLTITIVLMTALVAVPECWAQPPKQTDQQVLATVHDFGQMTQLWNAGKYAQIESLYQRAVEIEEKTSGKDNPDVGKLLCAWALHYTHRGLTDKSEPLYRRALTILEKTPKSNLDELKDCYSGLGYFYESKNQLPLAERYFKQALATNEKTAAARHDPNEELLAMSIDKVADVLTKQGKYSEAKSLLKRSLAMREATYGPDGDMVQGRLERLSEVDKKLGLTKDSEQASKRVLAIKKNNYGPILGPFYEQAQRLMKNNPHNCILPLSDNLRVGAAFNERVATAEIKKRFGGVSAQWHKIPNWLAGLWGKIPTDRKVKEVNGEVWDDPPPAGFYEGPGPFAVRRGCIQTKDGWWEYNKKGNSDFWTRGSSEREESLEYSFVHRHQPVTTSDGIIIFRDSTIFFKVKPSAAVKDDVLLPPGTIKAVWQEDREEVYRPLAKDQVALYAGTRIYNWHGNQVSSAPGDANRKAHDGVTSLTRAGKPAAFTYRGFDAEKNLQSYLTKQKLYAELRLLRQQTNTK